MNKNIIYLSVLLSSFVSYINSTLPASAFIDKALRAKPIIRYIHWPWIQKGLEVHEVTCAHCENSAIVLQVTNNKVSSALCENHFRHYFKKLD